MTDYLYEKLSPKYQSAEMQALKNAYNQRLDSILLNLQQTLDRIQQDELAQAMRKNSTSYQFVQLRIKEVLQEGICQENEEYIERLLEENAECKSLLIKYQNSIEGLSQEMKTLKEERLKESARQELSEREIKDLRQKIDKIKVNNDQQTREKEISYLKDLDQIKYENQNTLQELQNIIKNKQYKIEEQGNQLIKYIEEIKNQAIQIKHLQEELNDVKSRFKRTNQERDMSGQEINNLNYEISQLQNQIHSAKEQLAVEQRQKEEFLRKIDEFEVKMKQMREAEQINNQNAEKTKNDLKVKIKLYKKKLLDYKNKAISYENEMVLSKKDIEENKYLYEKSLEGVQNDLKKVKEE